MLGTLERTFEYVTPCGADTAQVEVRINYSYIEGDSTPGGSWDRDSDSERQFIDAERQRADGAWVPVSDADWLLASWCVKAFDDADDETLAAAVSGGGDRNWIYAAAGEVA